MSSVEGFSDKVCECGCRNLIPLRLMHKPGRKFLYGHKPKTGGAGLPVGDGARRHPRPVVVREVGYEPMRELVGQNIAAVMLRRKEIEDELMVMSEEREQMDAQLAAVRRELAKLELLRDALEPFCAVQAETAEQEGTAA